MKSKRMISAVVYSLPLLAFAFAMNALAATSAPAVAPKPQDQFWQEVRELVSHCAVQPFQMENGQKVYGDLESVCPEVQVRGNEASFELNGNLYYATMTESADADGGDLDDITVYAQNGAKVAERLDVPAFGDILLGLAGGQLQQPERFVQTSNAQSAGN